MKNMIFRNPTGIHTPLAAYSHQVEVSGDSKWLVMSGQLGMDKDGFLPEDVIKQLENTFDNIILNLKAAGMEKKNLVKLVFYFASSHDVEHRRHVIAKMLGDHQPCMTLLYVAGLANPDIKVEIDAWACSV